MTHRTPTSGAVAAGDKRAVDAGLRALREGGNAVDAAVAAALVDCVVEPLLTSLGGGGVALVRRADDGAVRVHDFFGAVPGIDRTALRPRGAGPPEMIPVPVDYGAEQQIFHVGPGTISVPGLPAGIEALHRQYGSLPMAVLAEPAVQYARDGFTVGRNLVTPADLIGQLLKLDAGIAALYFPDGQPLQEGAIFHHDQLAETLELFVREGAAPFYRGELAQRLLSVAGGELGNLTAADLRAYRTVERSPLCFPYGGGELITNPPPSAGGTLLAYALGIWARCAPSGDGLDGPALLRMAHTMEATDAVRCREFHQRLDAPEYLRELLGDRTLDHGARDVVAASTYPGDAPQGPGYTTHISTADADGWMVSLTSSNGETASRMIPGSGVLLNNFLGEEDLQAPPDIPVEPGSRIRTMMTPSLLKLPDGSWAALGSGGANRIRSALMQGIVHLIDGGVPVAEAVSRPRIHHEAGVCRVEDVGFDVAALAQLEGALGELVRFDELHMYFGGLHVVQMFPDGHFEGAGDPRRSGRFGRC